MFHPAPQILALRGTTPALTETSFDSYGSPKVAVACTSRLGVFSLHSLIGAQRATDSCRVCVCARARACVWSQRPQPKLFTQNSAARDRIDLTHMQMLQWISLRQKLQVLGCHGQGHGLHREHVRG